jgi:outer membrane protease
VRTIYGFAFFVSIFGVFSSAPLYAAEPVENSSYAFSIGSSMGFLYGQGEELVYADEKHDTYASQLLWDAEPLLYAGLSLYGARREPLGKWGFFGILDLKFGFPGQKTGRMEDRDWDASRTLTDFSSHDNYTDGGFLLDFSAGVSVPIQNILYIQAYVGLSYMAFKWSARDGYTQDNYDEETGTSYASAEDAPKKSVYGPGIDYSQQWLTPFLGVSLNYPFLKYYTLSLSAELMPLFCSVFARDDHFKRDIQFEDYSIKGTGFRPRGEISFSPIPRLSLSLFVEGIFMLEASGSSTYRYSGIEDTVTSEGYPVTGIVDESRYGAGAAFTALDMGLILKIQL